MELPAGKMLCGYVRGIDASYVVAQPHDLVMARADRSGYEFDMDRLMLMGRAIITRASPSPTTRGA